MAYATQAAIRAARPRISSATAMRWSRHAALMREAALCRLSALNPSVGWSRADCLASAVRRLTDAREARTCYPPARFALDR